MSDANNCHMHPQTLEEAGTWRAHHYHRPPNNLTTQLKDWILKAISSQHHVGEGDPRDNNKS